MFSWFKKIKSESNEVKEVESDNYKLDTNGNIHINAIHNGYYSTDYSISKESIISHTEEIITYKDYRDSYSHQAVFGEMCYPYPTQAIENKENFIQYKESLIRTFRYWKSEKRWHYSGVDISSKEVVLERTPLDIFQKDCGAKYKLIETEDEFNEYLSSTLDCDTWCRRKLYNKMQALGLGDGFINQFADLVGNNLDKYHAMIDLANEVSDKDTLMYLYTYKFSK